MSLEGYSDRQIIEEIERRLVDAECTLSETNCRLCAH